jgi:hypothetical protein
MNEFKRTFKSVYSISTGRPIVSLKWLEDCNYAKQLLHYNDYLLDDPKNPGLVRRSIERVRSGVKIFEGMQFLIIRTNEGLHRKDLFDLIYACGG